MFLNHETTPLCPPSITEQARVDVLETPWNIRFCKRLEDLVGDRLKRICFRDIRVDRANVVSEGLALYIVFHGNSGKGKSWGVHLSAWWIHGIPETVEYVCSQFRSMLFAERLRGVRNGQE